MQLTIHLCTNMNNIILYTFENETTIRIHQSNNFHIFNDKYSLKLADIKDNPTHHLSLLS
jgi:hypothetical protein